MEHTAKLELPLVAAAQAQKHVTVNEALERLDALAQIGVASRSGPPPLAPEQGECRIVSDDAAWNGIAPADRLAQFAGNAWRTFVPRAGWIAHVADESGLVIHDGTAWQPLETGGAERVERLGIATDAEAPNLFAVASDAALLSHGASGDHRLVVNKERSTDTASLVFQTGYGGRAEMGTAGGDDFLFKVSPDGAAWREAIRIDAASGIVSMPERPVGRATLGGGWRTIPDGSRFGFEQLTIARGVELGGPLDEGLGRALRVRHAGLYRVDMRIYAEPNSTFRLDLKVASMSASPLFLQCNQASGLPFSQMCSVIVELADDDELWLTNVRQARCYHGPAHSEVMVERL